MKRSFLFLLSGLFGAALVGHPAFAEQPATNFRIRGSVPRVMTAPARYTKSNSGKSSQQRQATPLRGPSVNGFGKMPTFPPRAPASIFGRVENPSPLPSRERTPPGAGAIGRQVTVGGGTTSSNSGGSTTRNTGAGRTVGRGIGLPSTPPRLPQLPLSIVPIGGRQLQGASPAADNSFVIGGTAGRAFPSRGGQSVGVSSKGESLALPDYASRVGQDGSGSSRIRSRVEFTEDNEMQIVYTFPDGSYVVERVISHLDNDAPFRGSAFTRYAIDGTVLGKWLKTEDGTYIWPANSDESDGNEVTGNNSNAGGTGSSATNNNNSSGGGNSINSASRGNNNNGRPSGGNNSNGNGGASGSDNNNQGSGDKPDKDDAGGSGGEPSGDKPDKEDNGNSNSTPRDDGSGDSRWTPPGATPHRDNSQRQGPRVSPVNPDTIRRVNDRPNPLEIKGWVTQPGVDGETGGHGGGSRPRQPLVSPVRSGDGTPNVQGAVPPIGDRDDQRAPVKPIGGGDPSPVS